MAKQIFKALTVISALMFLVTPSGITMGVPFFKVILNTGFWALATTGFYRLEGRL